MPRPFRARPKPADIRPELRRLMERACPWSRLLVFGRPAGFVVEDYCRKVEQTWPWPTPQAKRYGNQIAL